MVVLTPDLAWTTCAHSLAGGDPGYEAQWGLLEDMAMQNDNDPSEVLYWLLREQRRWQLGYPSEAITERPDGCTVVIVGVNAISSRLTATLASFGWKHCPVLDEKRLRNPHFIDSDGKLLAGVWPVELHSVEGPQGWRDGIVPASVDYVVACSDCGEIDALREWNSFCVARKIRFFPLVLQNLVGHLGPFVVPGETPCFECLYARQNSHLEDPISQRTAYALMTRGQSSTGFHVATASLMGDIAASELVKLDSDVRLDSNIGKLILVSLFDTRLEARKVLKIPRCIVCSPLHTRSPVTLYKPCPPPDSLADT